MYNTTPKDFSIPSPSPADIVPPSQQSSLWRSPPSSTPILQDIRPKSLDTLPSHALSKMEIDDDDLPRASSLGEGLTYIQHQNRIWGQPQNISPYFFPNLTIPEKPEPVSEQHSSVRMKCSIGALINEEDQPVRVWYG